LREIERKREREREREREIKIETASLVTQNPATGPTSFYANARKH